MPVFEKDGKRVLFIHIPKTGGTTVESAFRVNGFETSYIRGPCTGWGADFMKENGCSPQHMHAELLEKHFSDQSFERIFTVVREPVDRFMSEYRFRKMNNHPLVGSGLEVFAQKAFELYRKNPLALDNHLRPQHEFLWRDCSVFRLEDGLHTALGEVTAGLVDGFQVPQERAMVTQPEANVALSARQSRNVRRFYAADSRQFGYTRRGAAMSVLSRLGWRPRAG